MRDRGRMVLSMVVACALAGVLAPAADAHHNARRSSDFDRGWKFALANRTDIEVEVAKICDLAEVSLVVTDSSADPSILADLAAVGCDVQVAAQAR